MINSYLKVDHTLRKFDRILMPLPKDAGDYLDLALKVAKKGSIIHLYDFLNEDEFENTKKKIVKICSEAKKKCKILDIIKCGQFSPRVYRVCFDVKIVS